jgi:hypothetical protein
MVTLQMENVLSTMQARGFQPQVHVLHCDCYLLVAVVGVEGAGGWVLAALA